MATVSKKLVVVGDSDCGKSRLLTVFSGYQFSELFENYTVNIQMEGKKVRVALIFFFCLPFIEAQYCTYISMSGLGGLDLKSLT